MNNLERRILSVGLTLSIAPTFLTVCNFIEATDNQPTITSGLLPEITPRETSKPTQTPIPEPTQTPEVLIRPSVIIYHGDKSKAEIAFTFDDSGPGLHKILNICNQKGVKATFFLIAGELKANPDIWRQAVEDGHQICNHTVGHRMDLPKLSEENIKKEIVGWENVASQVLGEEYLKRMKKDFPYFRAPGGNQSQRLQQVLSELGYPITAYWSREDCWFKSNNPNNYTMVENYALNARNGDIFLAHGGTAGSVAEIIDQTEARGFTFKLLSEILD